MSLFADLLSSVFERRYRSALEPELSGRSIQELCFDLLGSAGEVSGSVTARYILDRYNQMSVAEKAAFFWFLTNDLGLMPEAVHTALAKYESIPNKSTYLAFMQAVEPRRQELARRLNRVPGATAQLVKLRADLRELLPENPAFDLVDQDFKHLFSSWFNRGFLVLRPINWESAAEILEKIIAYEAVHAIGSWEDLRRRVQPSDRRCYAFFHPAMPNEPLIFVEVALTKGVPGAIQTVLSEERDTLDAIEADTAVFYSISNCQAGLAGISFGNSLIKQVAADLSRDLPGIETFVTLSPIPGLNDWMPQRDKQDVAKGEALRQAAAYYLLQVKRSDGRPRDPVARFHLGNGALVHDVHAAADLSANGMTQSSGAMVNYLYDLPRVAEYHEGYATEHSIAASVEVQTLAAAYQKSLQ
ncbi:malonyl-CoA decarboxylase [Roseobacter sp. EG26]|uniref:malonyl-CoA decarboxylase n=1 Tax=Roseobacter sp. EG26 TaxID=3412477 RepID=UPI003CE4CECC